MNEWEETKKEDKEKAKKRKGDRIALHAVRMMQKFIKQKRREQNKTHTLNKKTIKKK